MQKTDAFNNDQEINENRLNDTMMIGDEPEEWTGHPVEEPSRSVHPHLCIRERYGVLTISVSVEEPDHDMEGRF